jgi:hypothetical protein
LPSPGLLFSDNTDVMVASSAVSHTLDVFITAQGLTTPLGNPLNFISGLTENILLGGFTATLSTFVSATNALFGGTALSSPYSVTAQYHIVSVAGEAGGANSTINIVGAAPTVPGPIAGAGLPG